VCSGPDELIPEPQVASTTEDSVGCEYAYMYCVLGDSYCGNDAASLTGGPADG